MLAVFATDQVRSTSACSDIPAGDRDSDGNQLDALGVCGINPDADADGICDDVDDCVGSYDACGCNGPGEIYECGCSDIPAATCDCDGQPARRLGLVVVTARPTRMPMASLRRRRRLRWAACDACGVGCNGPGEIYECGCSDIPAGDCDCSGNQLDALGVCGGDGARRCGRRWHLRRRRRPRRQLRRLRHTTDQVRSTSADA